MDDFCISATTCDGRYLAAKKVREYREIFGFGRAGTIKRTAAYLWTQGYSLAHSRAMAEAAYTGIYGDGGHHERETFPN